MNVDINVTEIRILYAQTNFKEAEIILNIIGSTFSTKSANLLSGGYYIIDLPTLKVSNATADKAIYNQVVIANASAFKNYPAYISNSVILLARTDGSQYLLYYSTLNATYAFNYQPLTSTFTLSQIAAKAVSSPIATTTTTTTSNAAVAAVSNSCLKLQFSAVFGDQACVQCATGYFADGKNCYLLLDGCYLQAASICIICQQQYVLVGNSCLKNCWDIFA